MRRINLSARPVFMWGTAAAAVIVLTLQRDCVAREPDCADRPYYVSDPNCASYPPPAAISALDMPLTWYFMPRRPGCARHEYRYQVELPEPCSVNLGGCGLDARGTQCVDGGPVGPELLESFAPLDFERLGHIPNDSLLGAAAGP